MAASWYLVLVVSLAGVMLANSQSTDTEKCTYGGREYVQGEQWVADGCGLTCYCSSAALNASFCFDKCQKFTHLPEGCKMEVTAGECCPRPKCDWMGKCTYKNKAYDQDEEWDDGCDYRCKCVDSTNSFVQCRSKCPTYTSIPSHCQLVSVPNKCCKELSCTGASGTGVQVVPAGGSTGNGGNPSGAGQSSGVKDNFVPPAVVVPNEPPCKDIRDDCPSFTRYACYGQYTSWAKTNCARFCGYCPTTGGNSKGAPCLFPYIYNGENVTTCVLTGNNQPWCATTGSYDKDTKWGNCHSSMMDAFCSNKVSNCGLYGKSACQGGFEEWGKTNCARYCGWCDVVQTPKVNTPQVPPALG